MKVQFGRIFQQYVKNFPNSDKLKIREFIDHVENFGFVGLQGRNKSSDHVPTDDPNWSQKVAYAQRYQLWHYHIGIPNYQGTEQGNLTSEYILHYRLLEDRIILVAMSAHPPFQLPSEQELI